MVPALRGSDMDFDLRLYSGGGLFWCLESTSGLSKSSIVVEIGLNNDLGT